MSIPGVIFNAKSAENPHQCPTAQSAELLILAQSQYSVGDLVVAPKSNQHTHFNRP